MIGGVDADSKEDTSTYVYVYSLHNQKYKVAKRVELKGAAQRTQTHCSDSMAELELLCKEMNQEHIPLCSSKLREVGYSGGYVKAVMGAHPFVPGTSGYVSHMWLIQAKRWSYSEDEIKRVLFPEVSLE
jgi:hypothetical protein